MSHLMTCEGSKGCESGRGLHLTSRDQSNEDLATASRTTEGTTSPGDSRDLLAGQLNKGLF